MSRKMGSSEFISRALVVHTESLYRFLVANWSAKGKIPMIPIPLAVRITFSNL